MSNYHTPECLAQFHFAAHELKDFTLRHPRYCLMCGGAGSHTSYDAVEFWGALISMPSLEACDKCIGQGRCSLCAHQHDDEWGGEKCAVCEWQWYGDIQAPELMDETDCGCFDAELNSIYQHKEEYDDRII
jgi:hypothetical protein